MFMQEIKAHLTTKLIPFWEGLKDEERGGYTGYMGYDLTLEKTYEKGCILNSRILWFFSGAYRLLREENLREDAEHAYRFLREHCIDREFGGVYWSVTSEGEPLDMTKHTYNQAFAIYALSSYYDAVKDEEALTLAAQLQELIEEKCRDGGGYLEAFDRAFRPAGNEKLSENGVMAERTMNTLLHVFEAYTEYYRVSGDERTALYLKEMLDLIDRKVYNRAKQRQEVFFDRDWHSLIDLHSYGHDIEAAWLIDRGLEILDDPAYTDRISPLTKEMTEHVCRAAYRNHSLLNEAENGVDNTIRVWWVQAEGIVGFLNGYQKQGRKRYLEAARDIWEYIKKYLIDPREGSEWFWCVDENGVPAKKPIVEPWKCPYHNGRMCMEVIRRLAGQEGKVEVRDTPAENGELSEKQ